MEVFTRLKPFPFLIRPTPLQKCKSTKALDEAHVKELTFTTALHEVLVRTCKDVAESNATRRMREQKIHNTGKNVLLLNATIGGYVMIRAHARKEHKLQTKWRALTRLQEAKPQLKFVVEDLKKADLIT